MTSTPAYTITESLAEGGRAVLHRAIRNADGLRVVLKVLDPRRARPRDFERLRHEHEIGAQLATPAAVKPLGLDTHGGMPALVFEDFGGRPLDALLDAPMPLDRFLPLAVRLASAVAEIHREGIVHRDLKPHNILVHPATGEVKLADFELASRLPREQRPPQLPRLIEGSFPYLAPEQTGRVRRAIDARTDLYSLGVTFFQMLTARLPFEARDPAEWVHCHVARAPPSPAQLVPGVPEPLARVVLKLLSKMPEDRYQSARGLRRDLERCLEQWRASGVVEPFEPGEHDPPDRLRIPEKLHGREAETGQLLAAFGRVAATGTPELVLVSGHPGIGKSALVHELDRPIVRERGFFLAGKFDQYQRDIPYSTFVQAFHGLIVELLAESEERLAVFRQRLLGAVGINGQLIVDVIPQVELVLGRQPPVAEMPPAEAQNRFRMVLRRFIGVFARKEHPLTLFLDDLQWADSASLGLLRDLLSPSETRYLLVIGAFRDSEVSPAHPLLGAIDEVRKGGARVSDIVLGPLGRADLAELVGEALHAPGGEVAPLADLVHEKTAGNPFFAIQFLLSLHEERLIERDGDAFLWDVDRIRAKGFTDNVVELMVGKLARLPGPTREALKQLACLGSRADVAAVATAHGRTVEETHASLWEAVRAGLVLRSDGTYAFLHDRVQEAAYSLIPEALRPQVHLAIGRRLLASTPEEAVKERVFDLVSHWSRGAELVTDPRERETLRRLDTLAGARAKAATAWASARSYLTQAVSFLPSDAWTALYGEALELHLELAECEYLTGDFERAEARLGAILEAARTPIDAARAHRIRMKIREITGRFGDAFSAMLEAVRPFGVILPGSEAEVRAATEVELRAIQVHMRGRRIADIADAPALRDPDVAAVLGLLVESLPAAYTMRPHCFALVAAKAVSLSLRYGNGPESCHAYSAHALALIATTRDVATAFELSDMALRLNEKLGDRTQRGHILFLRGHHIHSFRRPYAEDLPFLDRAFTACLEVGELACASYVAWSQVWHALEKGDLLDEVIELCQRQLAFTGEIREATIHKVIRLQQQLARSLKGLTRGLMSFDDDTFDEAAIVAALAEARNLVEMAGYLIMKQLAAIIHGSYSDALAHAEKAAAVMQGTMMEPFGPAHRFYHALALAALHPPPAAGGQEVDPELVELSRSLDRDAGLCPENFGGRAALVAAEIARLEGRALEAIRLYEQAIRCARDAGFVHHQALAYEVASRFYRARALDRFADTYLREARACYARWGADAKVAQLDRSHPRLFDRGPLALTGTFAVRPEQLDMLSVTKASQTISGEIVLDRLVSMLLRIVLEQGGAQKARLLLCQGGELAIRAEATLAAEGAAAWLTGPVPPDLALCVPLSLVRHVQRTGERVILSDASADAGMFGGDDYLSRVQPRSVLCMPVVRQAEVVGVLYLENNLLVGAFTPDRLVALELLATQAAISLQNATLLAAERAARASAQEAERRAAFLAEAGALLSESLEYKETFTRLGELCVRSLCDWCSIDIVEGQEIRRIAGAHADPAKQLVFSELRRRHPPRWGSPHPSMTVLRTVRPLLMAELPDDVLRSMCEDGDHLRLLRELGTESGLCVPLVARGKALGALTLSRGSAGPPYGQADLELAMEVARRAAIAIDNARLYRAEREAVRARDEFLTVASHELNTPLTSLMLALESLRRAAPSGRPRDPESMDRLLERAARQGVRLSRLVADLLDVSRIESGRWQPDLSDVDLGALVGEVAERFEADLVRSKCPLTMSAQAGIVGRWDRSRIDRVVTNLLSNAIKFGAGHPIEVTVDEQQGVARLTVHDHGIGIDPAARGRLFGRFERAVSERHYGGLGLGLYICRRIVEDHGGSIRCDSEPGAGATFTVDLPCAPPGEAGAGQAPSGSG